MKKIERQMSLILGTILSFCLSLMGVLTSEKPGIMSFIVSFVISFILSMIIGLIFPIKGIGDKVTSSLGLERGKPATRAVEALVSDLIFTPLITLAMIILAYKMSGGHMPFVPTFIRALIMGIIVGFIILFIITTPVLKAVLKKNGITMGGPPQGGGRDNG